jgi:uncharacterized protein YecT (DUF1311 family)
MKRIFFAIFTLLISITSSSGQTGETELHNQFKKSERELKTIVARFAKKLEAFDKTGLLKAQDAWIQYRALHCKFSSRDNEGGVIANKMKLSCMIEMTESRIKELKELMPDFYATDEGTNNNKK